MKEKLMEDANKVFCYPSLFEKYACRIKKAKYRPHSLDAAEFKNLVFMGTNDTVWANNQTLVDKLTPEGEPRTLKTVVERILAAYPFDHPLKIFKHLSIDEPWFDGCFIVSARFDPHLLGELKIRPLDMEEESVSPDGVFYLEDGNHRALVYAVFLRLGIIEEYKPVSAIVSDDWEHIYPWITKPSHQPK